MEQFFANFTKDYSSGEMEQLIQKCRDISEEEGQNSDLLKQIIGFVDLTSLNSDDSATSIQEICEKVNHFSDKFPDLPEVAAVCVYPVFSPVLKASLRLSGVKKAVVSGGFPSSQTFTDVKVSETQRALSFGVDEVDIVISVGEFLDGNYEFILEEIKMVKEVLKESNHLKVILETGLLKGDDEIWKASLLAMEGGADFIKTSTGKVPVNATPEAVYVMLKAIKSFYKSTGRKIGIKVAGGVSDSKTAIFYYFLVKEILGDEWLNKNLFRIGASSLVNRILSDIETGKSGNTREVNYF